ncbi:E3 ubiquitin-protein ligase RFI2 [Malania oleifera]|uniref:E3 ubiquitin-protein ligase RFI2 n=1 Tax=Malania oleifera TaxID=397392 RepID=UPI0025AE6807|nr:E3 ubiquitin-protein ligase RFI2 [Malania oleifera]
MVGSGDDDGAMDDASVDAPVSSVTCSICLDLVFDNGERSWAKLRCGHQFHLDCIGSAFNMKGEMQCPNCRMVEKGQWLYANGSTRTFPEFSLEDWIPDEDSHDLSYSEMPFRVQWCPFSGFTRVHSVFEEVESPSTTYRDLQGQHPIFTEHAAASSVAHSYVAYFGPINASENFDDSNFGHHRNGPPVHSEIFAPHAFRAIDIQYQTWGHHSPPLSPTSNHMNGTDGASVLHGSLRAESDAMPRPGAFVHPFHFGHGRSGPRAGSPFVSSIPTHHASGSLTHERIQVPHAFHHQQQSGNPPVMHPPMVPGVRRFNGPRGLPPIMPAPLQSEHNVGFYVYPPSGSSGRNLHEAETPLPNHLHAWERDHLPHFPVTSLDRDSGWMPFHQATDGSDSSSRSSSFRHRR